MRSLTPDETILGLLAAEARHGYQLLDCFRDPAHLGEVWNLSTSQLYNVLKRLEREGLLAGQQIESDSAPTRTEYTLTDAGRKRLEAWLEEAEPSSSVRRVRVEFLSRLYIARLLNRPTIALVKRQKHACQQHRMALIEQRVQANPGIHALALDLVIGQLDAVLDWIDRCELIPQGLDDDG
jgi:DNA-binding PadR family transcriptional regulator